MSDATTLQAWHAVATDRRLGEAALRGRDPGRDLLLGVERGEAVLLARRRDGATLGAPITLARVREGGVLVLPADQAPVAFELRGSRDLALVVLEPRGEVALPEHAGRLVAGHFRGGQEATDWLASTDGAASWDALRVALAARMRSEAARQLDESEVRFAERLDRSSHLDDAALARAVRLASNASRLVRGVETRTGGGPILRACRLVLGPLGIEVPPEVSINPRSSLGPVEQLCRRIHLQRRSVLLSDRWWREQGGPLLGVRASDRAPVALLPRGSGYRAVVATPEGEEVVERVDAAFAATLEMHAEMFYRGLPLRTLRLRDILRPILRGSLPDVLVVIAATVVTAGITAVVPVVTGWLVGGVIPFVQLNALLFGAILLLAVAVGRGVLSVITSITLLRIQTRAGLALSAGFVDRLLQLPAVFFRDRSSGDLTQRVMAIEQIRASLSQSAMTILLSFFGGLSNLVVLFVYDPSIALPAVGLVGLEVLLVAGISVMIARTNYSLSIAKGDLDGFGLDVLSGIRQIRVQGSARRVVAQIIERLVPVGGASLRLGLWGLANGAVVTLFGAVVPAVVFARQVAAMSAGGTVMDDGQFVAFITAVTAFLGATVLVGPAITNAAMIPAQLGRLRPLLEAEPEVVEGRGDATVLAGRVEAREVVFRYDPEGPAILDGVSFTAAPGEFVAIVGRTGCGKSTLLRILLGLEKPESGAILYDDVPLESLDPSLVRAQLGVVMQASEVVTGNVLSTILGVGSQRSMEEAWGAAALVGMDEVIDAMPMGMLTLVTPTSLSQSQLQRLLIARAIVGRPEILLFDEATSNLDNQSQAAITATIELMGATRIVVAHRLTTIRNAHRIIVLKQGKVVQQGTFEELAADETGHFRELMAGQLS